MNSINKNRPRNKRSYFYITEDPPIHLNTPTRLDKLKALSTRANPYFFIDFTENGSLRQMTKVDVKSSQDSRPLKIQQYGNSIITNVEDSSQGQQKLLKFQEQLVKLRQKKSEIRSRINHQLQKSKWKKRINSQLTLKQKIIDELTLPVVVHKPEDGIRLEEGSQLQAASTRWQGRQQTVLRRLGIGMSIE